MSPTIESNSSFPYRFTEYDEPPSTLTRFFGGLKAAGGASEAVAGAALGAASSWTGVGAVFGVGIAGHGADTFIAGADQIWSGTEKRTYTAEALEGMTGSRRFGDYIDAAIGLFGTIGAALSRAASGFRSVILPASRSEKVWEFGKLPYGVYGSTDPYGFITIRRGLEGEALQGTLDHELVHRFFSPKIGPFIDLRAKIGASGYANSSFLRATEEMIAESIGSKNIMTGIKHPFVNGYDIIPGEFAAEAGVVGGLFAKGADSGWELGSE